MANYSSPDIISGLFRAINSPYCYSLAVYPHFMGSCKSYSDPINLVPDRLHPPRVSVTSICPSHTNTTDDGEHNSERAFFSLCLRNILPTRSLPFLVSELQHSSPSPKTIQDTKARSIVCRQQPKTSHHIQAKEEKAKQARRPPNCNRGCVDAARNKRSSRSLHSRPSASISPSPVVLLLRYTRVMTYGNVQRSIFVDLSLFFFNR